MEWRHIWREEAETCSCIALDMRPGCIDPERDTGWFTSFPRGKTRDCKVAGAPVWGQEHGPSETTETMRNQRFETCRGFRLLLHEVSRT